MRVVVDARAGHAVMVGVGLQHPHDHLGVLLLAPGRGAVLAVAGDVEHRPSFSICSSAFRISFSLPAKCSQAGITGNGFSPANRAASG
jgi:hypothetical protein